MSGVKIIVVHYGNIQTTLNCLLSLKKSSNIDNIILVNNDKKTSGAKLQKKFKQLTIINNLKNLGYTAAVNIGIKSAVKFNPQYVLILNNDTIVGKNFLKNLLRHAAKHRLDITSPKILNSQGKIWFNGGEIDKNRFTAGHKKGKLDFLSGCCLLIKKRVFDKIGFFNEQYFMYYEDADFCLRAKKAGFKLRIAEKVIVHHHVKRSKKRTSLMNYYLARNHLLFVKKHAPLSVKIHELIRLPKTLWQHYRKKEFEAIAGIKDFLTKDCISVFLCYHIVPFSHFCCL